LLSLNHALESRELRSAFQDIKKRAEKRYQLIGEHPLMKDLNEQILRIAPTNATVLIQGESGTGKELVARAIHSHSLRAEENFVRLTARLSLRN